MVFDEGKLEDTIAQEMITKLSVKDEKKEEEEKVLCISSSVEIPIGCLIKKKLIVLDLNGLVADIVSPPPKNVKSDATIARKAGQKQLFHHYYYYLFHHYHMFNFKACND